MARRRPAQVHGLLAIDKPQGQTSRDVVNTVSRLLGERRAGHAGTLDPMATGALIVAFGEATKTVRWLMDGSKRYRARVRFGQQTRTDDRCGDVVRTAPLPPHLALEGMRAAARWQLGEIEQMPPAVSALKRDGVRDHERVRRGETVIRPPRPVTLHDVAVLGWDGEHAEVELTCGQGFYVRAWARDLGIHLHSAAHLTALRRIASSGFVEEELLDLDRLCRGTTAEARALLVPIEVALSRVMPVVAVDADTATALRQGKRPTTPLEVAPGAVVLVSCEGRPVCVARLQPASLEGGPTLRVERGFCLDT